MLGPCDILSPLLPDALLFKIIILSYSTNNMFLSTSVNSTNKPLFVVSSSSEGRGRGDLKKNRRKSQTQKYVVYVVK